jgi:hypothetical protein
MAKQKTKRVSFDTLCTETAPGRWEWETGKEPDQKWAYEDSWLVQGNRLQQGNEGHRRHKEVTVHPHQAEGRTRP